MITVVNHPVISFFSVSSTNMNDTNSHVLSFLYHPQTWMTLIHMYFLKQTLFNRDPMTPSRSHPRGWTLFENLYRIIVFKTRGLWRKFSERIHWSPSLLWYPWHSYRVSSTTEYSCVSQTVSDWWECHGTMISVTRGLSVGHCYLLQRRNRVLGGRYRNKGSVLWETKR